MQRMNCPPLSLSRTLPTGNMANVAVSVFCRSAEESLPCEDRAGVLQGEAKAIAWVIDGATGITDQPTIPGAETDAAWFAGKLSCSFERHLGRFGQALSLREHLAAAVDTVAAAYDGLMHDRKVDAALVPTASVVLLQASFENLAWTIEVARLGDCVCIVRDKQATRVLPSTLGVDFDREFDLIFATTAEQSPDGSDTQRGEALIRRRRTANVMDGYQIISAKRSIGLAAHEMRLRVVPPAAFLIVSDRMFRIVEKYAAYSVDELIDAAQSCGIEKIYRELRDIEADDPNCIRYPRVKPRDDASAVLGIIE